MNIEEVQDLNKLREFYYSVIYKQGQGKSPKEIAKLFSKNSWDSLVKVLHPHYYTTRNREESYYRIKQYFDDERRVEDMCKNL